MTLGTKDDKADSRAVRKLVSDARSVLKEPILQRLQAGSTLSEAQLETLIIDLLVEDALGGRISYDDKASHRRRQGERTRGVSRGAFNRTLRQGRRNVTRCLYTMLLLTYLGIFELNIFRPFEEVASRIGDYRRIREVLSGKSDLTPEDLESLRVTEVSVDEALEELASSLSLKTEISKRRD